MINFSASRLSSRSMSNDPNQFVVQSPHVLVVGAGINGSAVTRELVLNGVSVTLIDANDVAFGATSRSSRLIHGGLRYLERGDVQLVFESLRERAVLLQIVPQFVRPLRLQIPVRRRLGGLIWSLLTLLGCERSWLGKLWLRCCPRAKERGLWLIQMGLRFYDWLAARSPNTQTPRYSVRSLDASQARQFGHAVRWLCEYSDAQISFPERFVVTMLADAQRVAHDAHCDREAVSLSSPKNERGQTPQDTVHSPSREAPSLARAAGHEGARLLATCEILTHTIAQFDGPHVWLHDRLGKSPSRRLTPTIVINATGAWGDATLADWNVGSHKLFGGTKGSHFVTSKPELRAAIGANGLYAEAPDGRLVFILPFSQEQTLVGTTDELFDARPETAVAEPREIEYLIELVNTVVPSAQLSTNDVLLTCSGVRPLPFARDDSPSSIPRGHWIDENTRGPIPILTLIGGKLTTCRKLAEEVTDRVLQRLNCPRVVDSRGEMLPGAQDFPTDETSLRSLHQQLSQRFGLTITQVEAIWPLIGNRFEEVFVISSAPLHDNASNHVTQRRGERRERQEESSDVEPSVVDTDLPCRFVTWVIRHEWARSLSDLVERRLMLLYAPRLTTRCLHELAELLAEIGIISRERIDSEVVEVIERLRRVYGREVE
ncbi:MAG: FAD-dependent oxidoreductase [Planctomycetia bacterium]|nr:FAD-dependent oxidoreductase [Planctomycetia bacterium]